VPVEWKTYADYHSGFSINYPPELEAKLFNETPPRVKISFIGQEQTASGRIESELFDGYSISARVVSNIKTDTLDKVANEFLKANIGACPTEPSSSAVTDSQVGNIQAKSFTILNCGGDSTNYYVTNNDSIFELAQSYTNEDFKLKVDEITATFKLLGFGLNIDPGKWRSYINNNYKFSLRYPDGYSVTELSSNPYPSKLLSVNFESDNPGRGGGYSQPHVEVTIWEKDAVDLESWMAKHTSTLPFDDPSVSMPNSPYYYRGITNLREVELGGRKGVTFDSSAFESAPHPTLVDTGDHILGILLDTDNEAKDPLLKELYPRVLSWFHFID
jgi:hypothetical protein